MAKQKDDQFTRDLFGKNPVGRPPKLFPMTPAQRARAYRQRNKFNMLVPIESKSVNDEFA